MYALLVLFAVSCCACASTIDKPYYSTIDKPHYDLEKAEEYFNEFIVKYNKSYKSEAEKAHRFEIFKMNLDHANKLNKGEHHAVYGVTPFMDITVEEVLKKRTGSVILQLDNANLTTLTDDDVEDDPHIPESFDWRDYNVVTKVKDQGHCSSSYAFSVTGQLEAQYALKHRELVELSEQQILDCNVGANGCCGGFTLGALIGLLDTGGGIMKHADYPYIQDKRKCLADQSKFVFNFTNLHVHVYRFQKNIKLLLHRYGPLSIRVKAQNLHTYRHGIISEYHCSAGAVNHDVLLVGYGTEKNVPYWIVKNSWGDKFGEGGYFRMPRGENSHSCGMMEWFIYTVVQ